MDEGQKSGTEKWERRYRITVPMWSTVARNVPERGLVASNPGGIFQLHAWQVGTGELRAITQTPHGVLFGALAPDGRYVYYHSDEAGNEVGHWVRVPFKGGVPESLTPELAPYPSFSFEISGDSNRIGFSRLSQEWFIISLIDVVDGALGRPRDLFRSESIAIGPLLSWDGALAAIMLTERSAGGPDFNLVVLDSATGERLAELWDGAETSVEYRMFSPAAGDERILGVSNAGGTTRPFIWNPRTGERTDLAVDSLEGDVSPLDWSADARYILLGQIHQAQQYLYIFDVQTNTVRAITGRSGTWGWLFGMVAYFAPTGEIFAHWQDATHPEELLALDPAGPGYRPILPPGDVPRSRPWRSISFTSDGQEIQGWLCVPEGDGPFPTILHTHGGPTAATMETFDPECQAWVDHGFAFCTINYRGSTTFGREFQDAIVGSPGHREVADMVATRDWLVEHGVAQRDRILLTGQSYGGYLTLLALGLRPDLWAGGMAGIPVTDWRAIYEDPASVLKAFAAALLKGTPEERPEQYAASSPITYVDRVNAPVLIMFGRNDSRCPAAAVDEYIRRLKEEYKHVETYEFQGGHLGSFTNAEEAIRQQKIMLDFAARLVAGGVASPSTA